MGCLLTAAGCASSGGGGTSGDPRPTTERVQVEQFGVNIVDNTAKVDQYVSSHTIEAPADRLFAALLAVYANAGLAVAGAASTQGTVDSGLMRVRGQLGKVPLSRFIDCGSTNVGANADSYEVRLRVRSSLSAEGAGTSTLQSSVAASGSSAGNGSSAIRCISTGQLEERLARALRRESESRSE